jgi:hypothetical protein
LPVLKYYDATTGQYVDLPGLPGIPGEGVPPGGSTGEVLAKVSDDDFAADWGPAGAGSDLTDLENRVTALEDAVTALVPVLEQARDILIDHEARIAAIEGLGGVQIVFDSGMSNGFAVRNEPVTIHIEDNTGTVIPWSNVGEVAWGDGTTPNQSQSHSYTTTRPFVFITVVANGQVGVSQSFEVGLGLAVATDVPPEGIIYIGDTVTIVVTNLRTGDVVPVADLASVAWGEGPNTPPLLSHVYTVAATPRSVTATSSVGAGSGTSPSFTVRTLVPSITSVVPADGLTPGGESITINGAGFMDKTGAATVTGVTFGGTPATNVVVVSYNQLTCTAPAHALGSVTVVVESPYGNGSRGNGYYFWVMPVYNTPLVPNTGPVAGQNVVRINGTAINGTRSITFGGSNALQIVAVGTTGVDATAPPHAAGIVDVAWVHNSGQSGTLPGAYTYA